MSRSATPALPATGNFAPAAANAEYGAAGATSISLEISHGSIFFNLTWEQLMSIPVVQAVRFAILGVALAALGGVTSGQVKSTAKAMTLTPMDYVEIRQLVNRYAFALDTGSSNGYDYADLFAADGEFMRPYAKGREQLAALARGPRLGPDNTVHYIMNHVIEPTPDGAIGKAYLIEFNWDIAPAQAAGGTGRGAGAGPTNGWDIVGRKAGELARTGGHYERFHM